MGKVFYSERDLGELTDEMLNSINSAVFATAYKIRDDARESYRQSQSMYKNSTDRFANLIGGIMVGRMRNHTIKVHALGDNKDPEFYKARFFVGGTTYRKGADGRNIGFIKSNDALDKSVDLNQSTLENYIKNAMNL